MVSSDFIHFSFFFYRFNVDCSETEEFYSINEKIGSVEPIAHNNDVASDSKPQSQTSQRRQQEPRQETKPQSKILIFKIQGVQNGLKNFLKEVLI